MSDTWAQLATLAVALLCFQVGEMVHASGFVSAFAGGLAYAAIARHEGTQLSTQFTEATAATARAAPCSRCSAAMR